MAETTGDKVTITIYEGSLETVASSEVNIDPIRAETIKQQTPDERIGSVSTHEGVHAIDKIRDNKREDRAREKQNKYNQEIERQKPVSPAGSLNSLNTVELKH